VVVMTEDGPTSSAPKTNSRLQNLFFRALISANTSAAGLPARPTAAATAGMSARRNGLAAFSSSIVVGMVHRRRRSALLLPGAGLQRRVVRSMVSAKRILASVYSWPQ
jgi:hypothetical protein